MPCYVTELGNGDKAFLCGNLGPHCADARCMDLGEYLCDFPVSEGQGQGKDWLQFINSEFKRTEQGRNTLANDQLEYELQELAAILSHPCQKCAEDPQAWHTKSGFCDHKEKRGDW